MTDTSLCCAPIINLWGAYWPAWVPCLVCGILLTLVSRFIFCVDSPGAVSGSTPSGIPDANRRLCLRALAFALSRRNMNGRAPFPLRILGRLVGLAIIVSRHCGGGDGRANEYRKPPHRRCLCQRKRDRDRAACARPVRAAQRRRQSAGRGERSAVCDRPTAIRGGAAAGAGRAYRRSGRGQRHRAGDRGRRARK